MPDLSIAGYAFDRDKGGFACEHVFAGAPVLLFVHDADGDLQFLCGAPDHDWSRARPRLVHVAHLLARHPDLLGLPRVDFGFEAQRADADSPWSVSPIPPEA